MNPPPTWFSISVLAQKTKRPNGRVRPLEDGDELLFFLFFGLIALFADFVFFGRFSAALMLALLGFGDGFVAATGVLLALFAGLLFLVRRDATFVVAFFPCRFGFDTTTLTRQGSAAGYH